MITKDSLMNFFKEPTIENFKDFLEQHVGESNEIDFKSNWIEDSKLAKIIMAIANYGGGCIVIGINEKDGHYEATGIEDILDPSTFSNKIEKFFPKSILSKILLKDFIYDDDVYVKLKGKKFQVIFINTDLEDLPIICANNGDSVKKGDIYYRVGTKAEKISYEALQALINEKVQFEKSKIYNKTLKDELEQLKTLYESIPRFVNPNYSSQIYRQLGKVQNRNYPEKTFDELIYDMIKKKIDKIEKFL